MQRLFIHIALLSFLTLPLLTSGQSNVSESNIDEFHGKAKITALHLLAERYLKSDIKKAYKYAKEAVDLSEQIISPQNHLINSADLPLKVKSYVILGKTHLQRAEYKDAKAYFSLARFEAEKINYTKLNNEIEKYINQLDAADSKGNGIGGFFKDKIEDLGIGDKIESTTTDINISTAERLAKSFEENDQYRKSIEQYIKLLNFAEGKGDWEKALDLNGKIADLYLEVYEYEEATKYYSEAARIAQNANLNDRYQRLNDKINQILLDIVNEESRSNIELKADYYDQIETDQIDTSSQIINDPLKARQDLKRLAEQMEEQSDYKKSLEYYKLYIEIQNKLEEEESEKEKAILANELLKQEKEIQGLTIAQKQAEIDKQTKFRNNILIGSLLLLILAIMMYLLYTSKKKAHGKLSLAYTDLEKTQQQLSDAEKRIKTLLHQQVSSAVANALLQEKSDSKIERKFVCIMFLDIRDFTPFAETKDPEEIIAYQNDVFGFMITIVEKHHGIINQFLGDGFMATFGAPSSFGCDCDNALRAAKEIIDTVENKTLLKEIPKTKVGIGLHAGPVVAGNVGTAERKQYSITGNTVIIAARIEQLNKQLKSQLLITEEVFKNLKSENGFDPKFEEFKVKGRSENIRVSRIL